MTGFSMAQNIDSKELKKITFGILKQSFKNKIKTTFLINIYKDILQRTNDFDDLYIYFVDVQRNIFYNPFLITSLEICNHIVGVHNYNTILLNDYDRAQLQNKKEYQEKLIEQVLLQVKMRKWGSSLFDSSKTYGVENFMFYPCIYNMFYLVNEFQQSITIKQDGDPINEIIVSLIGRFRSMFYVINSDVLESVYPILRGTIELYATFIICKYGHVDKNIFELFLDSKISYNCHCDFDAKFLEMYDKTNNVEIHSYLNYGWIDGVEEAIYYQSDNKYKFSTLTNIVNSLYKKNKNINDFGTRLMNYYNACHLFTHGSIINSAYQVYTIMELCEMLGFILMDFIEELKPMYTPKEVDGVDIVKMIKTQLKDLKIKKDGITIEKLEAYYNQKLNYK